MRTTTLAEVTERIDDEARRSPGGALAFDGDGTLWAGDVGDDFFFALLESKRLLAESALPLRREARAKGIETSGEPVEVARRIYAAYRAGTFPEERVCEIMTWAVAGWRASDVDAFARELVYAVDLAGRLHREAIGVLEHARWRGLDVYVVSASPRPIVEAAARVVGIAPEYVVSATELRDDRGVVLPDVERPIPYGPGKVQRLRDKLGKRPLHAAFGDNAFDVAMLVEATVRVAIRPKDRLVERAAEVPGLAVLEAHAPQ